MRHQSIFLLYQLHPVGNYPKYLLNGDSNCSAQLFPELTAKCAGAIMGGGGKNLRLLAFTCCPVIFSDKTNPSSHIGSKRSIWNSLFSSVPDIHPGGFCDWDAYCRGES